MSLFPDADNTGQLELSEFQAFIDGPEPLCSPDVAYGATGERTLVAANTCHQLPLPFPPVCLVPVAPPPDPAAARAPTGRPCDARALAAMCV